MDFQDSIGQESQLDRAVYVQYALVCPNPAAYTLTMSIEGDGRSCRRNSAGYTFAAWPVSDAIANLCAVG